MYLNLTRVVLGMFWGWFLTDLFKHVGETSTPDLFTYWDAFSIVGFVAVIVVVGLFTMFAIIEENKYD